MKQRKIDKELRRIMIAHINSEIESMDPALERRRLEEHYGQGKVWDTKELAEDFEVLSFLAPFVIVKHRETGQKGSLLFQHQPRFYFYFAEHVHH
jgi:hypothetical protein